MFVYLESDLNGSLYQILHKDTSTCVTEVNIVFSITFLILVYVIVENILDLESFNPKQAGGGGGAESAHRLVLPSAVPKR